MKLRIGYVSVYGIVRMTDNDLSMRSEESKREKQKMKEVSVIIPTYNCEKYLTCAVESVSRQKVDLEIILVDDASADRTEELVKKLKERVTCPIRYIRNARNLGVSYSRNRGLEVAEGKYIAWLDADDWWDYCKLQKQLYCMKKENSILCYTGRELYKERGYSTGKIIPVKEVLTYQELLHHNSIACSSVLLRAEVAKEFPMEHDEIHEDYLTWLRILEKYQKACGINEPLLKTRLTANGKSRKKWKTFQMTYGVFRCLGMGKLQSIYYMGNHVVRSGIKYL